MSNTNKLDKLEKHNALLAASAGYRDFVQSGYALFEDDNTDLADHLLILADEATDYATWTIEDYKVAYDRYME